MKHRILISLILISFGPISCQEKKVGENTKTTEVKRCNKSIQVHQELEAVLKKQLEYGKPSFDNPYTYTERDLEVTVPILWHFLIKNGYKAPNNQEFNTRIQEIFNRKTDSSPNRHFVYANFIDKCSKSPIYIPNDAENNGIFVVNELNFITELYPIPSIIDYQKSYLATAHIENSTSKTFKNGSGNEVKKYLWKDISNLSERRKRNLQILTARNMYLFNADKSQYNWLIANDQYFMEGLVKTFGFTEDNELLRWVVQRTRFNKKDPLDYGKLFWIRECDEKARLHANTFKLLQNLYIPDDRSENRFILNDIKEYLEYLGANKDGKNLSKAENLKLMANLAYFGEQYKYDPAYKDGSRIMGRLRFFLDQEDVKLLEKNNYFNLPKFSLWWDNADYDEYLVEECEYNGSCGKDNQPLSMAEWRKQNKTKH
ncbi:hypothetical protein ACUN24_22375 [Pedobacter sp. WC2501]|uniref:hypothetical protein n=1 Tax=Pedobacter sp. WC2501 TaxID=3461400 RepID=UPI004045435A